MVRLGVPLHHIVSVGPMFQMILNTVMVFMDIQYYKPIVSYLKELSLNTETLVSPDTVGASKML